METFWFFWLWFRLAYDSLGHKRSYNSAYDSYSDSVASEKQPLENDPSHPEKIQMNCSIAGITTRNTIWVVHLPFCPVFDGESLFSIRLCDRQAN